MKEESLQNEIKREFQLERMILFSDAVFAIVITLMAIEIRIPEPHRKGVEGFEEGMFHILPTIFAYCISFFFIGVIWSRHLNLFKYLKDYDKGLIIRNLILLFSVGLFPFSASLLTQYRGIAGPYAVYFSVIILCLISLFNLGYYVFKMRPELRRDVDISKELLNLKMMQFNIIGFITSGFFAYLTYKYLLTESTKYYAFFWLYLFVGIMTFYRRRQKRKFKFKS